MSSLFQEIQNVSDHPDKCINYPVGDKLLAALREENQNSTDFVLSGVLIYAAAKILGRKVDFLEQEILGVAKNFEQISTETTEGQEKEDKPKDPVKKTRTRKYAIKDGVNLEKTTFEEIEIRVLTKNDINKSLAVPSKLSRLQKMKDFFAKNKAKSGKLAIPKSMMFSDSAVVSNFGSTLIHDYDDNKDIVGSRKDFASFSYYINSSTGELENDLNFANKQKNTSESFFEPRDNVISHTTAEEINSINENRDKEIDEIRAFTPPPTPTTPSLLSPAHSEKASLAELNISIDEGIDLDQLSEDNHILSPIQPVIKLHDFLRQSPNIFPDLLRMNEPIDINFSRSVAAVIDKLKEVSDFSLPTSIKTDVLEVRMKNIFMVPLKKLKHKCLFDLPANDEEFRELKRRKIEQFKPTSQAIEPLNKRVFKLLDLYKDCSILKPSTALRIGDEEGEDTPFLGFTKDEQNESLFYIPNNNSNLPPFSQPQTVSSDITDSNINDSTNHTSMRKESNDSGFESEYINTTNEDSTMNQDESCQHEISNINEEDEASVNKEGSSINEQINISGADSCIGSSLASGISDKDEKNASMPSFYEEFNVKNSTANEEKELELSQENQSALESEERVKLMRQSAINVAKWKEYLKPILAESEKRSKIDMHEYGLSVIKKIGNINETKTFGEIVEEGKTPAFFLTMLQLTNNRNIELTFANKSILQPTSLDDIKLTLKSKVVHREKFDEMGQQFQQEEENKKHNVSLKRKIVQQTTKTSTPAKRSFIAQNESLNFNTPDQSGRSFSMQLSQGSSGYFSQNSTFSDFE